MRPTPIRTALQRLRDGASRLPSGTGRRVLYGAGGSSGALLACYLAAFGYVSSAEIPRGTRVFETDIGGMSVSSATQKLREAFDEASRRPIPGSVGDRTVPLRPQRMGLAFDAEATARSAADVTFNPVILFRSIIGGREVSPIVAVDDQRLEAGMDRLAVKVDTKPRNGDIVFKGSQPKPLWPKVGRQLRRDEAAALITARYFAEPGAHREVKLPVDTVQPVVGVDDVKRTLRTVAEPATSAPITLAGGGGQVRVSTTQIAGQLDFVPDGSDGLRPRLDGKGLRTALQDQLEGIETEPKDAGFTVVDGEPRVVPGRPGKRAAPGTLAGRVMSVIDQKAPRKAPLPLRTAPPAFTTKEARGLGIKEVISSFTTYHVCCEPRVTNIHTIADIVDGAIVRPGETFSVNDYVGRRDRARGFVPAPMILRGRYVDSVGGGVSQFGTTLFNAVFFAGLEDVYHKPHSYYISRYPMGREATISFPEPDLEFRNNSPTGILIKTSYTDTSLTVTFLGTKHWEIRSRSSEMYDIKKFETEYDADPKCIPMEGQNGFEIDVWRDFVRGGEVVKSEKFHTEYLPEPRLECRPPPKKESEGESTESSPEPSPPGESGSE